MTTSEQIGEIAAALVKAQAAMKNATLNKVNPHFKSKYADLAGIRDTVTPALTANGIAVVQAMDTQESDSGTVVLNFMVTRLVHTSGQWLESKIPIPTVQDMQKMGSAITYARRYSLSAICGIAADEDDDANAASEAPIKKMPDAYYKWLDELSAFAATHTDGELIAEIAETGTDEHKAFLRNDTATLTALRSKAGKNGKGKAA